MPLYFDSLSLGEHLSVTYLLTPRSHLRRQSYLELERQPSDPIGAHSQPHPWAEPCQGSGFLASMIRRPGAKHWQDKQPWRLLITMTLQLLSS